MCLICPFSMCLICPFSMNLFESFSINSIHSFFINWIYSFFMNSIYSFVWNQIMIIMKKCNMCTKYLYDILLIVQRKWMLCRLMMKLYWSFTCIIKNQRIVHTFDIHIFNFFGAWYPHIQFSWYLWTSSI